MTLREWFEEKSKEHRDIYQDYDDGAYDHFAGEDCDDLDKAKACEDLNESFPSDIIDKDIDDLTHDDWDLIEEAVRETWPERARNYPSNWDDWSQDDWNAQDYYRKELRRARAAQDVLNRLKKEGGYHA